jgi:hypothetical protein
MIQGADEGVLLLPAVDAASGGVLMLAAATVVGCECGWSPMVVLVWLVRGVATGTFPCGGCHPHWGALVPDGMLPNCTQPVLPACQERTGLT